MTKQDILDTLRDKTPAQELQWMLALGTALTVSTRGYYPVGDQPGNTAPLIGFNELQHQVYGRVHHLQRGEEWTLESFVDGLMERGHHYRIDGDLGWALKSANSTFK